MSVGLLSQDEQLARLCLANGGHLTDPRYAHSRNRDQREEALKAQCRACWKFRKHFPDWVLGYMAKWQQAAATGGASFEEPVK